MPCYHPMDAVRMSDGSVKFVSHHKKGVVGDVVLPCGQCIGCRLERSRQWAMRCVHEASLHEENCFITLTYAPSCVPAGGSLQYDDFQRFMKRLRKRIAPRKTSFYVGGEYGENFGRPHYHACLFGYDFPDKRYFKRTGSGEKIFTSELLDELWPLGFASIGNVTFHSAAYIARYCLAKVNGDLAELHYRYVCPDTGEIFQRTPEFNHMSLKPAIGKRWLERFRSDVFPRDYVVINGVKVKPPKYYDRLFSKEDETGFLEIQEQREYDAYLRRGDNSVSRLAVKEAVKRAQLKFLRREL